MNRSLIIPAKSDTPSVILDQENSQFELAGRSLPEDANVFYAPLIAWVEEYAQNPNPNTVLDFKFVYYNSASARKILEIIIQMAEVKNHGGKLVINWFYETEDELIKDSGEELSALSGLDFRLIETED